MTLAELGWTAEDAATFATGFGAEGMSAARVVRTSKHVYYVTSDTGQHVARVSGGFRHRASTQVEFPAVGDWVAIKPRPGTGEMNIHALLERRTAISRQAVSGSGRGRKIEEQVLAANIDVAFLVAALDGGRGFNLRRLERYLTLAHNGGVQPVLVLNKADLCDAPERALAEAESIASGAPVHVVSAERETGIDLLERHLAPGKSLVLLGPSGVGKSSLINCLAGEDLLPVRSIRAADARGKHTTTWSEIRVLPGGGVLIDTPGMREVLPWTDEDGVGETFPEIRELARECKFSDCSHTAEPGCAVRAALQSGDLDPGRFEGFVQLRGEAANAKTQLEQGGTKREGTRVVRVRREKRRRWQKP